MNNEIKMLIDLYGTYYPVLIDTNVLIKALKKLPLDTQLPPKLQATPLGMASVEKRVGERIAELENERRVLVVRVDAIKEELMAIPGGADALKEWKWQSPKS